MRKHPLEKRTPKKIREGFKYILNGKFFETFELASGYADANGWLITHTEQIKGKTVIHVSGKQS